jgi:hypothetical protein
MIFYSAPKIIQIKTATIKIHSNFCKTSKKKPAKKHLAGFVNKV